MHCLRLLTRYVQRPIINKTLIYNKPKFLPFPQLYSTQNENELDDVINKLCKGDINMEKKLRVLMLEVEVMRQDGRCAPDFIKLDQWKHLLELFSRNQRAKYLMFLFKTEKRKENIKKRKVERKIQFETSPPVDEREYPDDLIYGIQNQSLFLRIRDQSINNFDNYRALCALVYGQSIVIDCSYEDNMVWREAVNAAKQMTFVFGDNRIHKDPFNIHMCNVDLNGEFMKQMRKNIPSIDEPWFPLNIHTDSYLDIFPKEKLVYLTPHCREELTSFNPDDVYIIGCMVDKQVFTVIQDGGIRHLLTWTPICLQNSYISINNEPLSLAKAKRDSLRMAKLPLDRYLEWAPGSKKNLNINHMISILLDLKVSRDWNFSLQHVPNRKLMETKVLALQKRYNSPNLNKQDLFKSLKMSSKKNHSVTFNERKMKSRRSLNDDESI